MLIDLALSFIRWHAINILTIDDYLTKKSI